MDEMVSYVERSLKGTASLLEQVVLIERIGSLLVSCLRAGHKLLIFGNGGSASQAQHFAAELVVKFKKVRKAWPAIALTSDISTITACGNDFGYVEIFRRQIEALAQPGDILLAFTTSGNAQNVVNALVNTPPNCLSLVFTGADGGQAKNLAHYTFQVASNETAVIQDAHQVIIHALSDYIERTMTQ